MRGKEKRQGDFLSHAIYEAKIPKDHMLRRLRALLDWESLAAQLRDCYRHRGRPSVPPEVMLRVVICQYLHDLSDRQMEAQLRYNLAFMFFVGLAPDEHGPDHSTLSRFRARVGAERFARLFNKLVEAAREVGIVGDRLHAIDARAVKANAATWGRIDRELAARDGDDDPPSGFVKFKGDAPPGSPDPDAAWGRKSKNNSFYGYKHHISVDADSGFIIASVVTPGNEHDGAVMAQVLDERAGAVVADKAYDLPRNHRLLSHKGIENRIIRCRGGNGANNAGRYVVERTNAIVKRWCGGGRARYWGLEKVSIQMLLASMAANLKRWLGIASPAVAAGG
jgi:IS5 family transposase